MVGSLDDVTWQALTVILTLTGLVASALLWRRRGPASGLRMLAIALLPIAAFLTGTTRLLWEIGDAVGAWAVGFAFSPFAWLGIVVAGASAALFAVSSVMRRRGLGTKGRKPEQSPPGTALPASPSRVAAEPPVDDDSDDIEAILKRHGIS